MSKSPMKAIREKCLHCSANQPKEIRACPTLDCALWKFRLGLHPFTEKNRENPFLEQENFEGLDTMQADSVIRIVGGK